MQVQLTPIPSAAVIPETIKDLYESAFPLYEKRPWQQQRKLFEQNTIQLLQIAVDEVFAGFVFYWPLSDFVFIEHFAIVDSLRGKGAGTFVMQQLARTFHSILLETEPEEKNEPAMRRILFYEKLGYKKFPFPYQQPPYSPGYPFQDMYLMHDQSLTGLADFERCRKEIYDKVYGFAGN